MRKLMIALLLLVQLVSFGQQFSFVPYSGIRDSKDQSKDYIAFNFPNMSSGDIKAAVVSKLSSLYNSPKDVINSIGDNVISLDASVIGLFYRKAGNDTYKVDADFTMTIHIKEGNIRYDAPVFHQLYYNTFMGRLRMDMTQKIYYLIEEDSERSSTVNYFNNLVSELNTAISKSNDW